MADSSSNNCKTSNPQCNISERDVRRSEWKIRKVYISASESSDDGDNVKRQKEKEWKFFAAENTIDHVRGQNSLVEPHPMCDDSTRINAAALVPENIQEALITSDVHLEGDNACSLLAMTTQLNSQTLTAAEELESQESLMREAPDHPIPTYYRRKVSTSDLRMESDNSWDLLAMTTQLNSQPSTAAKNLESQESLMREAPDHPIPTYYGRKMSTSDLRTGSDSACSLLAMTTRRNSQPSTAAEDLESQESLMREAPDHPIPTYYGRKMSTSNLRMESDNTWDFLAMTTQLNSQPSTAAKNLESQESLMREAPDHPIPTYYGRKMSTSNLRMESDNTWDFLAMTTQLNSQTLTTTKGLESQESLMREAPDHLIPTYYRRKMSTSNLRMESDNSWDFLAMTTQLNSQPSTAAKNLESQESLMREAPDHLIPTYYRRKVNTSDLRMESDNSWDLLAMTAQLNSQPSITAQDLELQESLMRKAPDHPIPTYYRRKVNTSNLRMENDNSWDFLAMTTQLNSQPSTAAKNLESQESLMREAPDHPIPTYYRRKVNTSNLRMENDNTWDFLAMTTQLNSQPSTAAKNLESQESLMREAPDHPIPTYYRRKVSTSDLRTGSDNTWDFLAMTTQLNSQPSITAQDLELQESLMREACEYRIPTYDQRTVKYSDFTNQTNPNHIFHTMNRRASLGPVPSATTSWNLTRSELENISKDTLFKYSSQMLHMVYDRLPENLQMDDEVQSYLPCLEHWGTPDLRTQVDGPVPSRRTCEKCQLKMWVASRTTQKADGNEQA